jgi:hypothetical protein
LTSCQAKTADGVKQHGPDVPERASHPVYLDAQTPKGTPLGVFVILKQLFLKITHPYLLQGEVI